ncbi:unnamed protein product [Rotaria sordida]|uniref:WD repeat-containing protein 65 n=1 Tax=Rotaria sordida TaxID=392033 RepID=A0A815JGX7_9BILA|nr:unnamed protein product [Rotaria sordida]CAF1379619.1 unnamed protein product [Rotaria sordida]
MSELSIKHIFGIRTSLSDCIAYLDEDCYLYPSSRHIILYNTDYKSQRLINYGNEDDILECLTLTPNKQYLAIALNTFNKSRIIIYDITGTIKTPIKRRKILSLKEPIGSNNVLSIVFSSNSKYLLVVYGAPDYLLACWSIDRFKSLGITPLHFLHNHLSHNPLYLKVSFNPMDSREILLTGNHIYRRYCLNNDKFNQYTDGEYQRCRSMNITCHCWLNQNHVLLGIYKGYICTVNNHGDIIQQYNLYSIQEFNIKTKSDRNIIKKKNLSSSIFKLNRIESSTISIREDKKQGRTSFRYSNRSLDEYYSKKEFIYSNYVICLLPFSRGVFVSIATGHILMYERNENCFYLTYLRRFILPSFNSINDFSIKRTKNNIGYRKSLKRFKNESIEKNYSIDSSYRNQKSISNDIILSLALTPNENTLLVATNYNNLYKINFSNMDYRNKESNILINGLDGGHNGRIIKVGISIRKPILFTLGIDRYLKIWNLQTNNQELNYEFDIEPLSLSVHPSGIFVCISFSRIIRIYSYTINGLNLFKQFQISNCQSIEYSNQGHILSISYDYIIQFHHHYDYNKPTYIRANDKFRLIRWSSDDSFLITVDFDEVIIRWNPYTGQPLSQYRILDFHIYDMIISSDNKLAYILTSDKKIKEFQLMTRIRDINIPYNDCFPTGLAINDQKKILLIGSQNGSIYSIKLTETNSIIDYKSYINLHQGAITNILISFSNDLIISTGDDGHIILYNLNHYQLNKISNITFHDEILAQENLLKEQSIELNNLIKREFEIGHEYENKIEIKEKEYIENFHQLDLDCQFHINRINMKIKELTQHKLYFLNQDQLKLNEFIENNEYLINKYNQDKINNYKKEIIRENIVKYNIEQIYISQNEKIQFINHLYRRYIQLIDLSYRNKINNINIIFIQKNKYLNERINYIEDIKYFYDEYSQFELNYINKEYIKKLKILLDKIEQLENEQVLLNIRIEQLEQESISFQDKIKEIQFKRNQFIDQIRQIDYDLNRAKQTIQQRNFIIQDKLKRTNYMENRQDELEKFAYVFNYKILELTNDIAPRQHELKALIQQYNNMDNEYDILCQNNEKYSIKIDDYKARLKATEKELQYERISIRKLNETVANIKEDLKLSSHFIDKPKELIKIIRNIYSKYILQLHTQINFGQMNLFDCERQRSYFERTNQRLQRKISVDIKRENIREIRRLQEQINMMREISSYCLKVVEVERILSDLYIISNIRININKIKSIYIIDALKIEQTSDFIQEKEKEINSIINKQEKRIQQLRDFIKILEEYLQIKSNQSHFNSTYYINSSISIDQPTIISSNSIHSQTSTIIQKF